MIAGEGSMEGILSANPWAWTLIQDYFVYRAFGCPEYEQQPRRWRQAMRVLATGFGIAEIMRPRMM